jgi:hypothetical protein
MHARDRRRCCLADRRRRRAGRSRAALAWRPVAGPAGGAQQGDPGAVAAAPPPAREENPGLFNEIGKLFEKSCVDAADPEKPKRDHRRFQRARQGKDAGDSLSRLAKPSSMVSGRAACPVSANGAPDCKAGADKLCQSKGFKEGKSLDTDSAETCSAKVLIPGRRESRRLPDRQLRHPRAVPVAPISGPQDKCTALRALQYLTLAIALV